MELEFKKIGLEDRELFLPYLKRLNSRSSETTFANLFLWSRQYPTGYTRIGDTLVVRSLDEEVFAFPMGGNNLKAVVDVLTEYERERGNLLAFHCVTPEQYALLEEQFPGRFQVKYDRNYADYVYDAEKLANLSGKKYHGKKNHVNRFFKTYPDWSYESVTADNVEECFQMALLWRRENGCEEDEEKNAEMCVALNSLRLFEELKLTGGLLRVRGEVVAFTIGEPACDDTFVVHIEKARADVEGAYTVINQQFVSHEVAGKYKYVNREDDVGTEGLRKAKLSYHPEFLVEKGYVTEEEKR
ncbi:MAG: phosphatidylglycerol lysyltransferase domain-containing protein [Lachnospiraceae bacterium]|nr:phosphatidylglycerol lysyltransferase domain-containing protein [Lachnospiraceae bacterium]